MTPEEKAAQEAEKKAKAEAQAVAKAKREEEQRQKKAEEEQRRQERADVKAREKYKQDKAFIHEALKGMSYEDRLEILEMVPSGEKPKEPKSLREQLEDAIKGAAQSLTKIEKLQSEPGFQELDLKPFALDLHMLADGFSQLSQQVGGGSGHGENREKK
jgi:hypothetical protein